MLCHRCGSDVESGATTCGNCGAPVKAGRRTFNRTITSFRGLEQQRQATADGLPARPGELLGGRFALDALIGRGPLGVVFTARDRDNQLDVALKIIDPALLPDDAARDNALTVLERARRLAHDGIVRVYAVGRDDDRLYVASERLEAGLTLAKVLGLRRDKKQRFTVAEAAPIIEQITTALLHAHRHLPHGGLKPENIQLLPTALKLTDFGLAAALPGERYAAAHLTAGELDRIAPELRDGQPPTARADIFGLGAILYEMLAGRAYTADAPSLAAAIGRLDDAPHPMDAIIRRATAADPAQRYENVEAFADAFTTAVDTAPAPGDDDVTRRVAVEDAAPRLATGAALDEIVTAPNRVRPTGERARDPAAAAVPERGADVALDEVVTAPNRVRPTGERGRDPLVGAAPEIDARGEDGRSGRAAGDGSSDAAGSTARRSASGDGDTGRPRDTGRRAASEPRGSAPPPPPLEAGVGAAVQPRASATAGSPSRAAGAAIQHRRSVPATAAIPGRGAAPEFEPTADVTGVVVPARGAGARIQLDPGTDPEGHPIHPGRGGVPGTTPSVLFDPAVLTDLELPPPPLGPPTGEHRADDRTPTRPVRPLPPKRPWYLGNLGFALTITALVGAAALVTWYWLDRDALPTGPQVVAQPPTPAPVAPPPAPVVVEPVVAAGAGGQAVVVEPIPDPPAPPSGEAPAGAPPVPAPAATRDPIPAPAAPAPAERPAPAPARVTEPAPARVAEPASARAAEPAPARVPEPAPARAAEPAPARVAEPAPARVAETAPARPTEPAPAASPAARATESPPPAPATPEPAPARVPAPAPASPAPVPVAVLTPPPAPPPEPTPAGPAELRCPAGMALLTTGLPRDAVKKGRIVGDAAIALAREGKAFCVDTHEYPGAGRPPRTGVNFEAARGLCRSAGKRLCTDAEWRRACVGQGGAGFPYGARFDAGRCNTEDAEGEERAVAAAGSFNRCVSPVGAYDMSGNVAEWTADQTVRGGDFASADDDAACSAGGKRAPASARASIGFRCCADFTDAAP